MKRTRIFTAAGLFVLAAAPAMAQDEDGVVDIGVVGSSRIGGPGLNQAERRDVESWDEPEEFITIENLPKKGSKQRLPGLHVIALRHAKGSDWVPACDRYQQIIDEEGEAGLEAHPQGRKYAGKSFLGCAEKAYAQNEPEKAERLLKLSEKYGGKTSFKHEALRRKMVREVYRQDFMAGNVDKAVSAFLAYHQKTPDEDERIWLGEELQKLAWIAYQEKDKVRTQQLIDLTLKVSPQHPKIRELVDKIETEESVVQNGLMVGFATVVVALLFGVIGRWRARAKVEAMAGGKLGKKNKFLDDDDLA